MFSRLMSACRSLLDEEEEETQLFDSKSGVRMRDSLMPQTHTEPQQWWDEAEPIPAREFEPLAEGEWEQDEAVDTQVSVYDSTGVEREAKPVLVEVVKAS